MFNDLKSFCLQHFVFLHFNSMCISFSSFLHRRCLPLSPPVVIPLNLQFPNLNHIVPILSILQQCINSSVHTLLIHVPACHWKSAHSHFLSTCLPCRSASNLIVLLKALISHPCLSNQMYHNPVFYIILIVLSFSFNNILYQNFTILQNISLFLLYPPGSHVLLHVLFVLLGIL